MATVRSLRRWAFVHKWTSLACTVFLLVFCLTGLPLIFREELRELLSDDPPYAVLPADAPLANLDSVVETARRRHPDHLVWFVFVDDDEPQILVGLLPSPTALPAEARRVKFDARTGEVLKEIEPAARRPFDFLDLMLRLHKDLFADLPGELFLGFIGLLFIASWSRAWRCMDSSRRSLDSARCEGIARGGSNGSTCTICWAWSRLPGHWSSA